MIRGPLQGSLVCQAWVGRQIVRSWNVTSLDEVDLLVGVEVDKQLGGPDRNVVKGLLEADMGQPQIVGLD